MIDSLRTIAENKDNITWPKPWHAMHFQRSKTLPTKNAARNYTRQSSNRESAHRCSSRRERSGTSKLQSSSSKDAQKTNIRILTSLFVNASARTCRAAYGAKTITRADCRAARWGTILSRTTGRVG
jgi:hypothetical protein